MRSRNDDADAFLVVANGLTEMQRAIAHRASLSLRVAALDQFLDVRGEDPREPHVPVPIFDLVPVMIFHVLDASFDLAGPALRAVPFDPSGEDEPLAPA